MPEPRGPPRPPPAPGRREYGPGRPLTTQAPGRAAVDEVTAVPTTSPGARARDRGRERGSQAGEPTRADLVGPAPPRTRDEEGSEEEGTGGGRPRRPGATEDGDEARACSGRVHSYAGRRRRGRPGRGCGRERGRAAGTGERGGGPGVWDPRLPSPVSSLRRPSLGGQRRRRAPRPRPAPPLP